MASAAAGAPEPAPRPEDTGALREDPLALLKALAEASAVFMALTFICGWSYLASYYKTFGLNSLDLDFSVPVVSTIAVYVLSNSVWPLVVAGVLILARVLLARRLRRLGQSVSVAIVGVLLLTAASAGVIRGRQLASADALVDSDSLPYVAFASKLDKTDQPSCVEHDTYGSMDCKLLLHMNGTYYFFLPVPRAGEGSMTAVGSMNLYSLADTDVIGVHIQRGLDRNARIE